MENIGIIDIGSNTVHLTILKINELNDYETLLESKDHLRLGSNINDTKIISDDKITKAQNLIKEFAIYCEHFNVTKIITVATEALRVAKNKDFIINKIKNETNLEIRILSKREEAFLSFLGTTNNMFISNGIIIDLGGNSTEIIHVINNCFNEFVSLPYGAINISEKIKTDSNGYYKKCSYDEAFFNKLFYQIPFRNEIKNKPTVGIGGTFKNLKQIYQYKYYNELNEIPLNLSSKDLNSLCTMICKMTSEERKTLKGLASKRHDIILGGCYLIDKYIDYCEPANFVLNNSGLRKGLIQNYFLNKITI